MRSNTKKIILSISIVLILLLIGISYAFFSYVYEGQKSEIITGQIYMNYEETSIISLTGVFPETKEQALAREVENGVFEFTITGRNTSTQPIYYEIDLLDGGVITGKTEASTKILPEHVRIYLERDGEVLIDGESYNDFNNRRVYTDTIPANQETNIEQKYKLIMWIDENVTISDTDPNADYTTTEWNDAYASLKIRVIGDFQYKEVATDASCFQYVVNGNSDIILDTSDEKVETCKSSLMMMGEDLSTAQDGYQSFCEGTGTIEMPGFGTLDLKKFVSFSIDLGNSIEELIQMLPVIVEIVEDDTKGEIEIINYDETCGTDVIIPAYIDGLPVTRIMDGTGSNYTNINSPFLGKGITSLKLPETLKHIGSIAFFSNRLTEVIIPDSVTTIGEGAFAYNQLTTVVLGKSVSNIDFSAFQLDSEFSNPLEKIVNKSGNAFNWSSIFGSTSSNGIIQDPGIVATGTFIYRYGPIGSDETKEILIVSE